MEKNSYTVEEAAKLKGCNTQAIREQIKRNMIPGCMAIKIKNKNHSYSIPKLAFDNHLRGVSQTEMESIRLVVREEVTRAINNFFNKFIDAEVQKRIEEDYK